MLGAEELAVDLSSIKIVQEGPGAQYGNQLVGGSGSVRDSWVRLRQAGATAKAMLIAAAANRWSVEPASCRAENATVIHETSKRRIGYGELAGDAAMLHVP